MLKRNNEAFCWKGYKIAQRVLKAMFRKLEPDEGLALVLRTLHEEGAINRAPTDTKRLKLSGHCYEEPNEENRKLQMIFR